MTKEYISKALRGVFPIKVDPFDVVKLSRPIPEELVGPDEVLSAFQPILSELERKLSDEMP